MATRSTTRWTVRSALVALVCAGSAPAPYLTQRLAPFDLDMHEFALTGRGVRTLRDRPRGERVFFWSDAEVVLAERVLSRRADLAAAAEHAAKAGSPLTDEGLLACYMCSEARESRDEWFLLYLHTLPRAQLSALSMDAEDLALLPRCYARCAEATRAYAERLHAACGAALEAVGEPPPPRDRFMRAFAHVRARSFALDEDVFRLEPRSPLVAQRGNRRALLPLLDLLNHRSGTRVRLERSEKSWRLIAEDACAAGEQVFNCYGERANLELLLHYGFALRDNAFARVGFDALDLLDGCVAARPREFGAPSARESLRARLVAEEASQRSEALPNLALFTFDASAGTAPATRPSERLRAALSVLERVAAKLGCTDEAARALPADVLDAMLRARLAELVSRLAEIGRRDDERSSPEARDHIAALLTAERTAIEEVIVERQAPGGRVLDGRHAETD